MSFVIYADKVGNDYPYIDGNGRKVIIVYKLPNRINKRAGKRWLGYVEMEDGKIQARSYSHDGINSEQNPNSPNNVVGYWLDTPKLKTIYSEYLCKEIATPIQDREEAQLRTNNFKQPVYVISGNLKEIEEDSFFDPRTYNQDKFLLQDEGIFLTRLDAENWREHLKAYIKAQIQSAK